MLLAAKVPATFAVNSQHSRAVILQYSITSVCTVNIQNIKYCNITAHSAGSKGSSNCCCIFYSSYCKLTVVGDEIVAVTDFK